MISTNTVQALKNIGKAVTILATIGLIASIFTDNNMLMWLSLGVIAVYCLVTLPVWLNK